ncbi:MAG TPA: hypothetical protein VGI40_25065 [Pirellulaceae bacterium]
MFVAFCLATSLTRAQDLVHVEEDWELVVAQPDANSAGPQIICTMSPFTDINGTYFTFEINHQSVPYWAPGGLTLHQWSGESLIQSLNRSDRSVMQTSNETVTWTQVLDSQGGSLTFQVKSGHSSTWGDFGKSNHLLIHSNSGLSNLNTYTPDVSAGRSGVAYAANRVTSLRILRVRGTLSDGTTATDNTVRVVHQLDQ